MLLTRKLFIILAIGILQVTAAQADFIGLNIDEHRWRAGLNAPVNNQSSFDLVDDLGIDSKAQSSLVLILEHPIAALPNIRYKSFYLDSSDSESMSGQTFVSGNRVASSLDMSHEDIVLYYELLNNWVDLDMGIDLKRFDGEIELTGNTASTFAIDETIPLVYLSARFKLPYQGFYIGADINNLSLSNRAAEDSTIKLGYESDNRLGFEGGIKTFSLELDDANNPDTNLKYDGIFLNGYYHF